MEPENKRRKRTVLTVHQKLEICKLISMGTSYSVIADKYGIGWSTIVDIKKNQPKLEEFSIKMKAMGMRNAKTMRMGEYELLDQALYIWFCM